MYKVFSHIFSIFLLSTYERTYGITRHVNILPYLSVYISIRIHISTYVGKIHLEKYKWKKLIKIPIVHWTRTPKQASQFQRVHSSTTDTIYHISSKRQTSCKEEGPKSINFYSIIYIWHFDCIALGRGNPSIALWVIVYPLSICVKIFHVPSDLLIFEYYHIL